MATLEIHEFRGVVQGEPVLRFPAITSQTISLSASSTQATNAFKEDTRVLNLYTDTACRIKIDANPTATSTSLYLPASTPTQIAVEPRMKIAAITA